VTVSDLHPDELLWREALGTLAPNERADLAAHLQRCPACALERVVRMEAARARVPSEADHAMAARLVDRVLAASDRRPVAALRVGWRRPFAIAAAVALFVVGTAVAATALVVRVREQRAARATPTSASGTRATAPDTVAERRGSDLGRDLPVVDSGRAADIGALSSEAQIQRVASPTRYRRSANDNYRSKSQAPRARTLAYAAPTQAPPRLRPTPTSLPSQAPERSAERAPPPPPSAAPSTLSTSSAVDPPPFGAPLLLRRAEQATTARRWTDASRAFAELGQRYPGTREEIVARALYGQLLLDQGGEPVRALSLFERYLAVAPSGALAEEARLGRAQALRRLGRSREERSAWLELLRAHPGSVHAAAARTRLATLDAP
jgi:TolA-binding protein